MAVDATYLYRGFSGDLNFDWARAPTGLSTVRTRFVQSVAESKSLHDVSSRAVIISASGMATGGRVLHHLLRRLPDRRNTVLFAGYQADGTRGRKIVEGARSIRMLGVDVDVRAHIENLRGFSAHGDREDLLRWVRSLDAIPRRTFVVHGEPMAARALCDRLNMECGHRATVAQLDDAVWLE
jgi:metallo-beta-lactamase family protein